MSSETTKFDTCLAPPRRECRTYVRTSTSFEGSPRMTVDDRTGAAPVPTGPLSRIDYTERIPNNVNLAEDRRLQRALEGWQPKFLDWWKTLGPALPTKDV